MAQCYYVCEGAPSLSLPFEARKTKFYPWFRGVILHLARRVNLSRPV